MRRFVLLCEELEGRPGDDDRVAALARWFAEGGRDAALVAVDWLLPAEPGRRLARPPRIALHRLRAAARDVAVQEGLPAWLFDAGSEACRDPAEAIALNLPDIGAPGAASGLREPTLGQWLLAWRAVAAGEGTTEDCARAVVRLVARLADRPSRRWAVRAVAAMGRPVVTPWQWMRAWARAFDEDLVALAWRWHTQGRMRALTGQPDLLAPVPRPRPFAPHLRVEAGSADEVAATADEGGARRPEPHWRGARVQVVRAGDAIALWHHEGELLNARLASLLHAVEWPDGSAIEAVLIGWQAGRVVSPWTAEPAASTRAAGLGTGIEPASAHLVLVDWHRWEDTEGADRTLAERRALLRERWPEFEVRWIERAPPPVFVTPWVVDVGSDAVALRRICGGILLRAADARAESPRNVEVLPQPGIARAVWQVPAPRRRVRAALQYVPSEALSTRGLAALGLLPCGFAVWSRPPRSARERTAGMMHSLSPLTEPDPARFATDGTAIAPARLLPLVRAPLALPAPELERVHAWVAAHAGPRFGAMNTVLPALVFELSFDAAPASRRHRAGVTLDDVRVERWLEQAAAGEADALGALDDPEPG